METNSKTFKVETYKECYLYYLKNDKLIKEVGEIYPDNTYYFSTADDTLSFIDTELKQNNCVFNVLTDSDELEVILANEYCLDNDTLNLDKAIMLKDYTMVMVLPSGRRIDISELNTLDVGIIEYNINEMLSNNLFYNEDNWQPVSSLLQV